jgi:hypothetical protein
LLHCALLLLLLLQCVELDFQYPSEGIHRRWDAGFRITACAATPDQSAFVLSVPRRRPMDETQVGCCLYCSWGVEQQRRMIGIVSCFACAPICLSRLVLSSARADTRMVVGSVSLIYNSR